MTPNTKDSDSRPGWAFPSGLKSLVSELAGGVPTLEEVILNHTRYSLYKPFLSAADQSALLNHHIGIGIPGIASRVGIAVGGRSRMAVCLECMQLDMKNHGYAVWRRLQLMPDIVACHIHQAPLYVFCSTCESGHRRTRTNWRPKSQCICGRPLRPIAKLNSVEMEASIAIARMSDQILRGDTRGDVTSVSITQALRHCFGGGNAALARFTEALNYSVGPQVLAALGIGFTTIGRLLSGRNPGPIRNPIQNIAALYAAFGGLDKFSEELSAAIQKSEVDLANAAQVDIKIRQRRKSRRLKGERYRDWVEQLSNEELVDLRNISRRWLLNIMVKNPGIKRGELWRKPGNYSALRFLMHVDADWFDELLPHSPKLHRASIELTRLNDIAHLIEQIKSRYEKSLKLQPWKRITKTYLLSGASSESRVTKVIESEEVQACLKAHAETPTEHRKRQIQMVCSQFRNRDSGNPLGDVRTYTKIKDRSCVRRLNKARIWLSQNQG